MSESSRPQTSADSTTALSLTLLNGDTSWLIELDGLRLLLDPWLLGPATVGHPAVHRAYLGTPALRPEEVPPVDALIITHPFPDHCNRTTLRTLPRDLPAFTPTVAWPFVKALGRFHRVAALGNCTRRERAVSVGSVTLAWCRAAALFDTTHNALVIRGERSGTTLVYSPHGLLPSGPTIDAVERQSLGRVDALLCTFSLVDLPGHLGGVANLGPEATAAVAARLHPRYVLSTHDGDKPDTGLIARATRITRCRDIAGVIATHAAGPAVVTAVTGQRWTAAPTAR
ncbi:MAG TPA: MBL fold metallo-hydrolase [Methylomirabilota bacterium]|jgi:L-ascorbate metabolism protein UlaG (beta-lactamase superfamily)|nr:MBL fold metallo-hydrolase [Methylomirabilota bacterium]